MNKKVLASILALGVIISVGYFSSSYVLASDNTPHDQLITRIAQKFNLKASDVEAVFTAVRDEKMDEMKKRREEKLSQAVKDGFLTESQKTALLNKMPGRISHSWFKSQGIDETKLRAYLGFGGKQGMGIPR